MRTLIVLLATLIVSTVHAADTVVIDVKCDKFAQFARSLNVLKSAGYTTTDQKAFIVEPKVAPFPIAYVQSIIFVNDWSADEAYKQMYTKCTFYGFDYLTNVLKTEQDKITLTQENADLKHELADTQVALAQTQRALAEASKVRVGYKHKEALK